MSLNNSFKHNRTDNCNLQPAIKQRDFIINADPPYNEDWKPTYNPEFPIEPDVYGIDLEGCYVSHYWDESMDPSLNKFPSIRWERNFSLIRDVSYFNITSASVNSIVNATVHANNGSIAGVDCSGDSIDVGAKFDFVTFYIIISDLEKTNEYQIAYFRTKDLGKDIAGEYDFLLDTYMNTSTQSVLIFYLEKVLETGDYDFTVSLGINIYCEDNYFLNDVDYWDILRIKSFNLTFTYEFQSFDTKSTIEGYNLIYLISTISIISMILIIYPRKKNFSL